MRDDYYSFAFMGYIYIEKFEREKIENLTDSLLIDPLTNEHKVIEEIELSRNFMHCVFIFSMQMILIILLLNGSGSDILIDCTLEILVARLICALVLHM